MQQKLVGFLNAGGDGMRNRQDAIRQVLGLAATAAQKGDGSDPEFPRGLERAQNIGRIAAACEHDQNVAGLAQPAHLSCKDLVIAVVRSEEHTSELQSPMYLV